MLGLSGNIKLYADEFKSIEENKREFDIINLPRTVYVEALDASTSNNDIKIKAFIGNNEVDKVSATAIWVKGKMKYVTGKTPFPCTPAQTLMNGTMASNICNRVSNNGDL